jgi:murein DD-endopeptidase MepM/ murein hydrolase activator NlpD
MNGLPVNGYQIAQLLRAVKGMLIAFVFVLLIGNIIGALVRDPIRVRPDAYLLPDGFPLFTSRDDYLKLVREYRRDFGVNVAIHVVRKGESLWDIARGRGVSIDTIIAANPFLTSLNASEGMEIVVPGEEGVLQPVDNMLDVVRMRRRLPDCEGVSGRYLPGIFEWFSKDDMRFVFFKGARPVVVNRYIARLYEVRRNYQAPVLGYFSSMFGMRGEEFHSAIDISAPVGTPIRPIREGIVSFTGWMDGYGKTIMVLHPEGYVSTYGHLAKINVAEGQTVEKKTVIGTIGMTGRTTGPHLHLMMSRHGRYIDPLLLIW